MASLATSFAIAKLMTTGGPKWMIRSLRVLFIASGGVMFGMAFLAYHRTIHRMKPINGGFPTWVIGSLTLALLVGTATGLAFIFVFVE